MSNALDDLPDILDILADVNERPCSASGETGNTLPCLNCDVLVYGECSTGAGFCSKCEPQHSVSYKPEPIPLSAPDGRIFVYACPRCERICNSIHTKDKERLLEESKKKAESCCLCRECGALVDKSKSGYSYLCATCSDKQEEERKPLLDQWAKEREQEQEAREVSLTTCLDRDAARLLLQLMSGISEDYYCAGWMGGLEYSLWFITEGGSRNYGMGQLTDSEVAELKRLSEKSGGWWYWSEDHNGEMFMALDRWREEYEGYMLSPKGNRIAISESEGEWLESVEAMEEKDS